MLHKKEILILFIFLLLFPIQIISPQNISDSVSLSRNMWPLNKGIKYQYFYYTSHQVGVEYRLDSSFISSDTLINGLKYFSFNNSKNFFRYDIDSNKAYLKIEDSEGLYIDFNTPDSGSFSQFTNNHNFQDVTVTIDSTYYFGEIRKTFKWETSHGFYRSHETFAEELGIIVKGNRSFGPGPDSEGSSRLINALLYDGSCSYIFYTEGYEPEISFNPFTKLNKETVKSFKVGVDHFYNNLNKFLATTSDGIIYIDSVFVDLFYQKDLDKTQIIRLIGSREDLQYNYSFNLPLDTSLILNGYELNYRIGAKDKALIPVYKFSPDTGFYKAVYDPLSNVEQENKKMSFSLSQNFPNPFNPVTKIKYNIPENSYSFFPKLSYKFVTIKVYDILGNEIATLVNEEKFPGEYEVEFNGEDLSSGLYFYRLNEGNIVETKKMILLK